jgi:hypothetical protein
MESYEMFTILMFFVLIAIYFALFGVVRFAENVITKTQLAPLNNSAPTRTADSTKSP